VIRVGRSFWVVLALLAVSLTAANVPILAGSLNEKILFFRISYLGLFLMVGGWAWAVIALRWMTVQRTARTLRQQVGQIFEERFEITNRAPFFRMWIEVRDTSDLPFTAGSRLLTWVGGHQSRSYLSYTWLNNRGQFTLGPTVLAAGDVFGLFQVSRKVENPASLLVVPYMVALTSFPAPRGMLPGGRALRRKSLETTPYAAGVREYAPGDPLNRIHWPTTVRRDTLMVKEFEQDPQSEVWIFVDANKRAQASIAEELVVQKREAVWLLRRPSTVTLPADTLEYSVSAAASIASYFIRGGQMVGLVNAGQVYTVLQAERGDRQMAKILENLALLKAEGYLPLVGLVAAQSNNLPKGSTVVLITPAADESVVIAAGDLLQRGMFPVVVAVDAGTFGSPRGTEGLIGRLQLYGVPVFKVTNHGNLQKELSGDQSGAEVGLPWWKNAT
jgi:uncharacterized protein (DUF58 family)